MNEISAKTQHSPGEIAETWIAAYTKEMLEARDEATIEAYTRVLEKFAQWLSRRPGNSGQFRPQASPLYDYLQLSERKGSAYVFISQRAKAATSAEEIDGWRSPEDGLHQWWQQFKAQARL